MPYLKPMIRVQARRRGAQTAGELNYILTLACIGYAERKGLTYETINDILGALAGAQAEFYRRVAVPYEDRKIAENGDVFPATLTHGGKP